MTEINRQILSGHQNDEGIQIEVTVAQDKTLRIEDFGTLRILDGQNSMMLAYVFEGREGLQDLNQVIKSLEGLRGRLTKAYGEEE